MDEIMETVMWLYEKEISVYHSFYISCTALTAFQFVVEVIATYAAQINIATEIAVRVLFFIILSFIFVCFENGLSYFQIRVLLIVWLNSAVKACSVEANPFETLIYLSISISPLFNHFDKQFKRRRNQTSRRQNSLSELPISSPVALTEQAQIEEDDGTILQQLDSPATMLLESIKSILFLTYLLARKEIIHPDILHVVTCLYEEQTHLLWAFFIWSLFKTLHIPATGIQRLNQTTVISIIELSVGMLLSGSLSLGNFAWMLFLLALMYLRNLKPEVMNLTLGFFVFYYFTLNFWVNAIDLLCNNLLLSTNYYHDEDFVSSFSFKSHTSVNIVILSIISAQFLQPSIELFKEHPVGLTFLHGFTLGVVGSLFVNFLIELTAMAAETRFKVFRQELLKVFVSAVIFYFMTVWLTSWVCSLSNSINNNLSWKEDKIKRQRNHYDQQVRMHRRQRGRDPNQPVPEFQVKPVETENEMIVRKFEHEGIEGQTLSDILQYLCCKFEYVMDQNCTHLLDSEWKQQAYFIQNTSVFVFLVLVHIPLTKVSAAFSCITGFVAFLIDNKTQMTAYEMCKASIELVCDPRNAMAQRKLSRTFSIDMPGNSQASTQKLSNKAMQRLQETANWVCLIVLIFVSILLNFCYTTFLQDFMALSANYSIKILDQMGLEVHFVRLLHMALFEKSSILQEFESLTELEQKTGFDIPILLLIIFPMFFGAMHFFVAPIKRRYKTTVQVVLAPVLLVPIFFWQNFDICIMGLFVLMLHFYMCWYHIDGEYEHNKDDSDDSEND